MNCDECKEQVLELIERESFDAEGVRAILARCPECREEFEQLKATLAAVADLPFEEPPSDLDAQILSAANARAAGSAAASRPTQRIPWAIAAVAVLGIGVGLSQLDLPAGPERIASAPEPEAPAAALEDSADLEVASAKRSTVVAEESLDRGTEGAADEASPAQDAAGSGKLAAVTPAETRKKRAKGAPRKREANYQRAEAKERPPEVAALAAESDADFAARAAPSAGAALADESASSDSCRARVRALETRLKAKPDYAPSPEEQLAVGLCYGELGQSAKARVWLERASEHSETARRATEALERLE